MKAAAAVAPAMFPVSPPHPERTSQPEPVSSLLPYHPQRVTPPLPAERPACERMVTTRSIPLLRQRPLMFLPLRPVHPMVFSSASPALPVSADPPLHCRIDLPRLCEPISSSAAQQRKITPKPRIHAFHVRNLIYHEVRTFKEIVLFLFGRRL